MLDHNNRKMVGVMGGMGPEATVDLLRKIIKHTPVKIDQDHLRILIDNNPQVPCRVKAILEGGEDPSPQLIQMAKNLEKWGAHFIVIPCNTAHYYAPEIEKHVNIPIINMVKETVKEITKKGVESVTLLASSAVIETGLYSNLLEQSKISYTLPSPYYQELLMNVIFNVKSGNLTTAKDDLTKILQNAISEGSDSIILGCSELPIILAEEDHNLHFFDPTTILAKATVQYALNTDNIFL
jgi:aspartate racemase